MAKRRHGAVALMAPPRWYLKTHVAVSPAAAYAWMTDYRDDDHSRESFLRHAHGDAGGHHAARSITKHDKDLLEIRDRWGRNDWKSQVRLDRAKREVHISGDYGYRATWRAVSEGEGTRIECEGRIEPSRFMARAFASLLGRRWQRQMEADFKAHVGELEEELTADGPPTKVV